MYAIRGCAVASATVCLLAIVASTPAVGADSPDAGVEQFLQAYTAAFNQGDPAKLAEFWTEDATWESTETGEKATGRKDILAGFADFFAENPGAHLAGAMETQQPVADGVVCVDGRTTLMLSSGEAIQGTYHAVLKKNGDGWQMAKVIESDPPVLESTYTKLESLEPLIGEWRDQGDGPTVLTTFRWGAGKSFLIRSFTVEDEQGSSQGTQVIGWDPREGCIRSWTFHSDGSFGEGTWSHSAGEWTGRLSQTLLDGTTASATQVVRLVDDNTLEVETVGREVDGEPLPSAPPVKMVRVDPNSTKTAGGEE